jgi:hypothetical protein
MQERPVRWRKSSYSGPDAECVEVALTPTAAAIRDTKNRTAATLTLPHTAWATLVTTITS